MNHSFKFYIKNPDYEKDPDNLPEEIEISGEVSVTSYGSSATYWDPGDPPEWEVEEINLDEVLVEPYLNPPDKTLNPEWSRLAELVDAHMLDGFDWSNAQNDAAEDYYDYRDER